LHGKGNSRCPFKQIETQPTPAKACPYQYIKTICHQTILLRMYLEQATEGTVSLKCIKKKLKMLRKRILISQSLQPFQDILLSNAIYLTLGVITKFMLCKDVQELEEYNRDYSEKIATPLNHAGYLATKYQLTGMKNIILNWEEQYNISLLTTYIIIVGARGPKEGLIEQQLLEKLLESRGISKENTSSGGIIYSEMLPLQMNITAPMLIDDLARELLNREIGQVCLGNQDAMKKDVLGKHAPGILSKLGLWKSPEQSVKSTMVCPFHR
jgi:hypothetical protein